MPKETSYELKRYLYFFDDGMWLYDKLRELFESVCGKIVKKTWIKKEVVNHESYDYRQLVNLIDNLRQVYELLGVLSPEEKEELIMKLSKLKSPYREERPKALSFDDFHKYVSRCIVILSSAADKLSELSPSGKPIVRDPIERGRFIEGLSCFLRRDFLASIVMIVSVVERRLFLLMRIARPDKSKELERRTFGKLIEEYLKSKGEYKVEGEDIVPEKYEHMLRDINKLRILSAHPKEEEIEEADARRLIIGAVQFLRDTYEHSYFEEKVIDVSAFVDSINESSLDEKVNEFLALKPKIKKRIIMAIMDKIHTLDWQDAPTYSVLCDFLKMAVKQEDDAKLQCELLAIIIEKTCGYRLYDEIKLKLLGIIAELTRLEHVRNFVKEKNLIKLLMAEFKLSGSYKEAAENAQIMLNLESCLTPEQINRIAMAALSNDQILYSYGAQDALRVLFSRHYDEIDESAVRGKLAELKRKDPKIARLWTQIVMGTWR